MVKEAYPATAWAVSKYFLCRLKGSSHPCYSTSSDITYKVAQVDGCTQCRFSIYRSFYMNVLLQIHCQDSPYGTSQPVQTIKMCNSATNLKSCSNYCSSRIMHHIGTIDIIQRNVSILLLSANNLILQGNDYYD